MTANRDPRTMSRDELVAYFDGGGDISELLREAVPGPALGQAPAEIPMIVTGVRLPSAIVERLDALAGNDKASCLLRGKASPGGIPHFTDGRWW